MIVINVLAIDQSSSCSGWANMDENGLKDCGLIDLKGRKEKLYYLRTSVNELYKKFKPEILLWENLKGSSFGRGKKYSNPDTTRVLGEVTGVLRCFAEEYNIPYIEYVPSTVKSVCCSTKDKVILGYYIADLYGLQIPVLKSGKNKGQYIKNKSHKFFNITDAIALGHCYFKKNGG